MGAAPASQSEDLCRTKRSLSDKGTPRSHLAPIWLPSGSHLAPIWRWEKAATKNCCRKFQKPSVTAPAAGSVPGAILQPSGDEKKPAERTGADWDGHKTRNAKDDYILHHEQNLSLSKDETQYSKPSFLHAFYKSFMESIWQAGTPLISTA